VEAIGLRELNLVDAARDNRDVPVEVYYPAESSGENVPVSTRGPAFPVLVFGHGFQIRISFYDYLWQELVPEGYIVVLVDTTNELLPDQLAFGEDMAFTAEALAAAGADAA